MWLATSVQLARFMSQPIWTKKGALAFNMKPFVAGSPDDHSWGYPERSASIAVLGGLTDVAPGRGTYGSCMLPYELRSGDSPADLKDVARIDHLRNAYAHWGAVANC
jgi:hypothetical protein